MAEDGAFERGSGSDLVQGVGHPAEYEPEHLVVGISHAWHQLETPLEAHDVGCRGQIPSQLVVQKPRRAGHDAVAEVRKVVGEEHLRRLERLIARGRRQRSRLRDVNAESRVTSAEAGAEPFRIAGVVPEQRTPWSGPQLIGEEL